MSAILSQYKYQEYGDDIPQWDPHFMLTFKSSTGHDRENTNTKLQ